MDKAQLEHYRQTLMGTSDPQILGPMVDQLGMDGTPRAITLLLETLRQADFPIRESALKVLLNIDQNLVFTGLRDILQSCAAPLRIELVKQLKLLDAAPGLLVRMESWASNPGRLEAMVAALDLLGFIGNKTLVEPIASYLYHLDGLVKEAAVRALQRLNCPECLNHVFAPLKLSDETLALQILDLVGSFKDTGTILQLLYALSGIKEPVQKKIMSILTSFPHKALEQVAGNHLSDDDPELCRNVLRVFESTGKLKIARKIRAQFRIADTIPPSDS